MEKTRRKRWGRRLLLLLGAAMLCALLLGGNALFVHALGRKDASPADPARYRLGEDMKRLLIRSWWDSWPDQAQWLSRARAEDAAVTSRDGLRLSGEAFWNAEGGHRWVILVHGYGSTHVSMLGLAAYYGAAGYHALLPDARACGGSEGDWIGMGWLDRLDLIAWAQWIIQRDPEAQIALHGVSMGGAAVMMAAGEALPPQVRAVVEDCGYASVWDTFRLRVNQDFHLPAFPLVNAASAVCAVRAGYGIVGASAVRQVQKARVPVLFIHGGADDYVPTEMVYRLYDACASEKQLLVVEGAGHAASYRYDPKLYFDTVFAFLDRFFAPDAEFSENQP